MWAECALCCKAACHASSGPHHHHIRPQPAPLSESGLSAPVHTCSHFVTGVSPVCCSGPAWHAHASPPPSPCLRCPLHNSLNYPPLSTPFHTPVQVRNLPLLWACLSMIERHSSSLYSPDPPSLFQSLPPPTHFPHLSQERNLSAALGLPVMRLLPPPHRHVHSGPPLSHFFPVRPRPHSFTLVIGA